MKLSLILDIDKQYTDFFPDVSRADLSALVGVNGYCSEEAAKFFRNIITKPDDIHLFGSGNYHYISKFFLETISRPFNLLLIDNHPDLEAPAFPLLSCGSWVLDSLQDLPNLQHVYMVGVNERLLSDCLRAETGAPYTDRILLGDARQLLSVSSRQPFFSTRLPLYISIDKDALTPEYARTDWDQGELTLDNLVQILSIVKNQNLLGADICGDSRAESGRDRERNRQTTKEILDALS